MIASIRGRVASIGLNQAVIDVGGVGIAVRATPTTLAELQLGENVELATTLVVREDSLTLFGFASNDAKSLFELVQSVSGVGPKISLALLAVLTPAELRTALASGDTTTLTRAPGIGRKSAERLVLELGDKVAALAPADQAQVSGVPAWSDRLVDALEGLGFTTKQARSATATVAADLDDPAVAAGDIGVLLRRALGALGKASR